MLVKLLILNRAQHSRDFETDAEQNLIRLWATAPWTAISIDLRRLHQFRQCVFSIICQFFRVVAKF